jgi:hypothetical protein
MSTRSEQKKNCYDLNVDEEERQITLLLYSLDAQEGFYDGPQEFAIRVSGLDTNSSSFALIDTTPNLPIIVALTGLSLVVVIVYLLVRNGADAVTQTLGKKTYLLNALFLDVQTSSYSLSKCQFYAWTATAVLGYLFLVVSKSFVQGSPTFPDIPSGLPAILLASVGTAVLSTGITTTKGDKGAASPEPSLSDFISTGGVIAADRLQFAIWTVIGIGTFVAIIFKSDPRNINDLPSIPSGFLELMGISAGGYLVGKLVRKAGPTLNAIAISGTPTELSFQLTGSGLSQSAVFSVDGAVIYPDTIRRDAGSSSKLPNVVQVDPTIGDPSFARILQFTCLQSREEWLGGPHDFMITNPDSQRATISFKIFQVVDANLTAVGTTGNATLSLNGLWLDKKFLKVECIKNNGSAVEISEPEFSPEQTRYKASIAGVRMGDTLTVKVTDTAGVVVIRELIVLDAAAVSPKQVTPSRGGNGANATVASGVSSELAPSQPTSAVTKTNHNP